MSIHKKRMQTVIRSTFMAKKTIVRYHRRPPGFSNDKNFKQFLISNNICYICIHPCAIFKSDNYG